MANEQKVIGKTKTVAAGGDGRRVVDISGAMARFSAALVAFQRASLSISKANNEVMNAGMEAASAAKGMLGGARHNGRRFIVGP